jgi:hypothetical protein
MATSYQVVATRKAAVPATPYHQAYKVITHVKLEPSPSSSGSIFEKEAAARQVELGNWRLFTKDPITAKVAEVHARHLRRTGQLFLESEADKSTGNNLLNLPDC